MESIKDRVAIIGMGCTQFGELWDKSPEDLMIDACYEAFEDAGIEPKDIQAAWFSTVLSGFTGAWFANALKLDRLPITRVENFCCSGQEALRNGAYAVAAGIYDVVLVCGMEKLRDRPGGFAKDTTGPFDTSRVGGRLPPVNDFARLATGYFHRYGLSIEEGKKILAKIAVKNHYNGSLTPKAHLRRRISEEDALNAPIISFPLGLYDCCGMSDGAAAAIITRADMAQSFRDDYILIKGAGLAVGDGHQMLTGEFDFTHLPESEEAAQVVYQEAGIKNPRQEISVANVHDCFTIHELTIYESLGFSPRGRAKEDVEAGTFTLEGELPVNTDGGLKCFGHPIGASGLRMAYEIYKQLQGKCGERQVRNARIGLTHNLGGLPFTYSIAAVTVYSQRD